MNLVKFKVTFFYTFISRYIPNYGYEIECDNYYTTTYLIYYHLLISSIKIYKSAKIHIIILVLKMYVSYSLKVPNINQHEVPSYQFLQFLDKKNKTIYIIVRSFHISVCRQLGGAYARPRPPSARPAHRAAQHRIIERNSIITLYSIMTHLQLISAIVLQRERLHSAVNKVMQDKQAISRWKGLLAQVYLWLKLCLMLSQQWRLSEKNMNYLEGR